MADRQTRKHKQAPGPAPGACIHQQALERSEEGPGPHLRRAAGEKFFPAREFIREGAELGIQCLVHLVGDDHKREGLVETPQRVLRAWRSELCCGYGIEPRSILKTFDEDDSDQMVILRNVEFFSTCEHHLLPFFGKATVAYVPNGRVVGVSKLARLLEIFSRRLQIQERICKQVTHALMKHLKPKGAACVLSASHLCMRSRGVNKQESEMVTSSLEGTFLKDPTARAELMSFINHA